MNFTHDAEKFMRKNDGDKVEKIFQGYILNEERTLLTIHPMQKRIECKKRRRNKTKKERDKTKAWIRRF